jgi:hypothetical protein
MSSPDDRWRAFGFRDQAAGGPLRLVTRLPGFVDLGGVPYPGCAAG